MSGPLQFNGELTLAISVTDLDAGIGWYQETLGFELLYRKDEIGWCELKSPVDKVTIGLSQVEAVTPGGATPTFGVTDVAAAEADLKVKGVKTDGDIMVVPGMVKLLTFFDPDGNSLMLFELDE